MPITMSWLRTSPLRTSFSRTSRSRSIDTTSTDCDPKACYDSFCKHWQQVYEIILRAETNIPPTHDDVLGVVNHLDHMVTLLLLELHNCNKVAPIAMQPQQQAPPAPCLEYLLSENLLDKLYEWGKMTGRYADAVRLEQLKLYEQLVTHSRHQLLLVHEPFLRPLLKMLVSSQDESFPTDVEKRLVILLNQLCVVLMQNVHLLDLFFCSSSQQQQGGEVVTNFIIFSLLIPYVHSEGSLGHQARDALLLCMALSQKNSNVGTYIARYSSMCPVLVTGLGGLYSSLPNTFDIVNNDWYRITPDDIANIPKLTLFMNSLEFCNAVVQVAHDLIKQQLLDFMYQGFIVPVLGPALLQIFKGKQFQTNFPSQIAAMAYLDLILRSVTEPALLKMFIKFLLDETKFDGDRILDVLVERLMAPDNRLCLVTLSLFDTLLSLCCEDIMLELLLKYLLPCKHVPILHRYKINKIDPYTTAVDFFLELSPESMKQPTDSLAHQQPLSKTIGANWNHYGLHSNDTLYSNYHAYLCDARQRIQQCRNACDMWSNTYRYQKNPSSRKSERTMELIKSLLSEFGDEPATMHDANLDKGGTKQLDSLQSLGESSGYESLRYRYEEDDTTTTSSSSNTMPTDSSTQSGVDHLSHVSSSTIDVDGVLKRKHEVWKQSNRRIDAVIDLDFSEDLFAQGSVTLGPFLSSILRKLQTFTSNCLFVNLHLTGLISRLAWYPLPLIHSLFMRPDIPTTSDTPSFHQVLKILKQQIDAELPVSEQSLEQVDIGRTELIERECRLVNARNSAIEQTKNPGQNGMSYHQTSTANISAITPPQLTPSSSYDPFKRTEPKRKSISFSSIFRRPSSGSGSGHSTSSGPSSNTNARDSSQMGSIGLTPLDYSNHSSLDSMNSTSNVGTSNTTSNKRTRDLAVCAVVLDEWLKELAAISQEQSIVMLTEFINHF